MLSRGAERCLEVLRWYAARFRRVFVFQRTLAVTLGRTLRQIQRYVRELKQFGFVLVKKEGRGPATYRVVPVENSAVPEKNVVSKSRRSAGDIVNESKSQLQATPVCVAVENSGQTGEPPGEVNVSAVPRRKPPMPDWRDLIPPRTVVNEMGRHVPNDAFYRVRDALIRGDSRIRSARSPDAYALAIVRGELKEARCG